MYASQRNVQILVALLKKHGVSTFVLSPGSRNMAIVRSLETDPFFTCYSVVDERSAAYVAVGLSLESGAPVGISCTSAQATRNYIPGMTEAYYRGVPLVTITADYKPSMIGQGIMQTVEQMSIPRDTAKVSVQLPVVVDDGSAWHCRREVNAALLALRSNGTGPVHINIPIEEHWEGGVDRLPDVPKIELSNRWDRGLPEIRGQKVLVVIGEHAPFTPAETEALESFVQAYGAVVFTNHLSNYHGEGAAHGSIVIEGMNARAREAHAPDLLVTIGKQVGDYGIDSFLQNIRPRHWRVSEDGRVVDTYRSLEHIFQMPETEFFHALAAQARTAPTTAYQDLWAKSNSERSIPEKLPLSHAFVAATLSPRIPPGSVMHFAILSAFRNWNFFELDPSVRGFANVAGYGIDGCMSTFIGHSLATEQLCFLVVGDLSFFYDMNVIGIRHVKSNARIVLVNNDGGGEFRLYTHAADQYFGIEANRHIAAAGHHGPAQGWVESMGWEYIPVRTKEDLVANAGRFIGPSDKPILMEVFTTMQDDSDGVRVIQEANTHESLERRIAKHLSPGTKRAIKKMLGRG